VGGRRAALCGAFALAAAYGLVFRYLPTLTGAPTADGVIGVALGLYTCSLPAANAIDVLFYSRGRLDRLSGSGMAWAGFNCLVMVVGWLAIVAGVMKLVD
jgi:hypothetical protein